MACLGFLSSLSACIAMPVTSLAGCIACQACSCLASSACSCCCTWLFCTSKSEHMVTRSSRLIYLILFIAATIIAGVLRDQSDIFLKILSGSDVVSENMRCSSSESGHQDCMPRALVLRMCFGSFFFHLFLAMLTYGAKDFSNPRVLVHTGLWPLKIFIWLGLHVVTLFIPSSVFLGYKWAVLVLAIFFLLVQIIIFVEWVFEINEMWIEKDGAENLTGPYHILIIVIALFCLVGSIVFSGLMFKWFSTDNNGDSKPCGLNIFFTAFNLILFVILTLFSFRATSWMPSTGLLPSALVSAFLTFKVLMAQFAQNQCNEFSAAKGASYGSPQVVAAISIIIATLMAALSSIVLSQDLGDNGMFWGPNNHADAAGLPTVQPPPQTAAPDTVNTQDRSAPLLKNPHHAVEMHATGVSSAAGSASPPPAFNADTGGGGVDVGVPDNGPLGYSPCGFHVAFMLGICYVTMQLTEWNEDFENTVTNRGLTASMWIKIADSWLLALAFGWSMLAPVVCTSRNFGS